MSTEQKPILGNPTRDELRQDVWRPEEPDTTLVRKKWGVAVGLVLLAGVLMLAAPATAQGPPLTGGGSGIITDLEITSSKQVGGNEIQTRRLEATLVDGPLQGTFVEQARGVIHRDGRVTFQGTMEFVGELEGCGAGTLTAKLSGTATVADPETGRPVMAEASFRTVGRAGSTIPATAHGTLQQVGPLFTYEVSFICHRGGGANRS